MENLDLMCSCFEDEGLKNGIYLDPAHALCAIIACANKLRMCIVLKGVNLKPLLLYYLYIASFFI
jgi:hypothetical protein